MKLKGLLCGALGALMMLGVAYASSTRDAEVAPIDTSKLAAAASASPELVAPGIDYSVDLATRGEWTDSDGWSTWTYAVRVPGAQAIAFHAAVSFPPGSHLDVGDNAGNAVKTYDAFTTAATKDQIWSVLVPGEVLRLTLTLPSDEKGLARIDLDRLFIGLKASPISAVRAKAASAAATVPPPVNWSCERTPANELAGDATVMYTVNFADGVEGSGLGQCTGTLMNDVPHDGKLYMLTAAHCGQTNYDSSSITVYWNAVSSCTDGLKNVLTGGFPTSNGGTTRALYATGGINHGEDQWLIELSGNGPPAGSNAAFSGWDASDVSTMAGGGPTGVFGINHTSAQTKQYTVSSNGPTTHGAWPPGYLEYTWTTGSEGPGASGSGLFESDDRLIATLSTGGGDQLGDQFSGFNLLSAGWHGGGGGDAPTSSVGVWLDPGRTGTLQVDGAAAPAAPTVTISVNPTTASTDAHYTVSWSSSGASSCSASGAWTGSSAVSGSASFSEAVAGNYTYTLTCSNIGGSTASSATVVVTSPSTGSPGSSAGGGGSIGEMELLTLLAGCLVRRRRRHPATELQGNLR